MIDSNLGRAVMKQSHKILLLILLSFAFAYRLFLLTANTYPPGADIGLHQSVINSILTEKTLVYNHYHMGGGVSVTNPGYHIFSAIMISFTGIPDYLGQALVAAFFSSMVVLCAFLITKRVWDEKAGFLVAFLAMFSSGDIIMLAWSGYPNTVTLMLIPMLFYLYLEPFKLSSNRYLIVTAIIVCSVFLTHIFSALVLVAILGFTLFLRMISRESKIAKKKQIINWILPIICGILLSAPYLLSVLPVYLSPEFAITGTVPVMKQAVLETRLIPLIVLGASMIPIFLFPIFSKIKTGRLLTTQAILCVTWIIIPVVSTQSYLFGFYLDYERFLYFLSLPIIIACGILIFYVSCRFLSIYEKAKRNFRASRLNIHFRKFLLYSFTLSLIILSLLTLPVFSTPVNLSIIDPLSVNERVNFFQVMDQKQYEAIEWIKSNTPEDAVFVADAEFGWWLSGFAKRRTLSAVDPQYLILRHEFEPARVANNLLKANYIVSNGLIEVKQKNDYSGGGTYEFQALQNDSYIKSPIFTLNDKHSSILFRHNGLTNYISLTNLSKTQSINYENNDTACFIFTINSDKFTLTQKITIIKGVNYAKISISVQSKSESVSLDWLQLPFVAYGFPVQHANSLAFISSGVVNQIIFPERIIGEDIIWQENPESYHLMFNLKGRAHVEEVFFIGQSQAIFDYLNQSDYWHSLIENNTRTYLVKNAFFPISSFNYESAITEWQIAYIAIRKLEDIDRFSLNPTYTLVFSNDRIAIFKTNL